MIRDLLTTLQWFSCSPALGFRCVLRGITVTTKVLTISPVGIPATPRAGILCFMVHLNKCHLFVPYHLRRQNIGVHEKE